MFGSFCIGRDLKDHFGRSFLTQKQRELETKDKATENSSKGGTYCGFVYKELIFKFKKLVKSTIITSDTELIERTYIVTPTVTGVPARKEPKIAHKKGQSQGPMKYMFISGHTVDFFLDFCLRAKTFGVKIICLEIEILPEPMDIWTSKLICVMNSKEK